MVLGVCFCGELEWGCPVLTCYVTEAPTKGMGWSYMGLMGWGRGLLLTEWMS